MRRAAVRKGAKLDRIPEVTKVEVLGDFVLRLEFDDGFVREVDLEPELWGEMFEPLRNPAVFRQVKVDREMGTIVWPNGADLSREFLRWGDDPPAPFYPDRPTP